MESQLGRDQPRRPVCHAPHLPTSLFSCKLSCSYSASVVSTEANAKARVVEHLSHAGKLQSLPQLLVFCVCEYVLFHESHVSPISRCSPWSSCHLSLAGLRSRRRKHLLRSVARVRARHGPSPSRPEDPARLSRQVFFPCTNSLSHYRALLHTFQVPDDLRKAMANLGSPNPNEARAVDARQEIDLKVRKHKPYVFHTSPISSVTRLQGRLLLHTLSNPIFSRPLQWLELCARIVWPLPGLFFETAT
jgi:hypothetical protein